MDNDFTFSRNTVLLINKCGQVGNFETFLAASYEKLKGMPEIEFDLSELKFIGAYSSALFFTLVSDLLINSKKKVSITLGAEQSSSTQTRKMLLDLGILAHLKELGALIQFQPSNFSYPSYPLTIIDNEQKLKNVINNYKKENITNISISSLISDLSDILIKELIENSLVHNSSKKTMPYLYINSARSTVSENKKNKGMMATFDLEQKYLEICIGDFGMGIYHTIKKMMPEDYNIPYQLLRSVRKAEKVLFYAFEFSSTRDTEARKDRMKQLYTELDIDPSLIASGLYCILALAKKYRAQFILRTPECILSYDFVKGGDFPIIKGASELGIRMDRFAPIPGTHYTFRFSLNKISYDNQLNSNFHIEDSNLPIDVITPFYANQKQTEISEETLLENVVQYIESYLYKNRSNKGITIIESPIIPISSRTEGILIYILLSLNRGNKKIIWNYPRSISQPPQFDKRKILDSDSIIVGDLFTNSLSEIGIDDQQGIKAQIGRINKFAFSHTSYRHVLSTYFEKIKPMLIAKINEKDVRYEPGPFLIPMKYYTKTFFRVEPLFQNSEVLRILAIWATMQTNSSIELIIAHSQVMEPLAIKMKEIFQEIYKKSLTIITIEMPLNPPQIIAKCLNYHGLKAVVLTEVVCLTKNITDLLKYLYNFEIEKIVSIVDARTTDKLTQSIIIETAEGEVLKYALSAILYEYVETYRDLSEYDYEKEPLIIIDPNTHKPTLYIRHITPTKPIKEITDIAYESKALFQGHFKHYDHHYSYFIFFPHFFSYYKFEIGVWIKEQIEFVIQKYNRANICLFNSDNSLSWINRHIIELGLSEKVHVTEINTIEELEAPKPPVPQDIEPSEAWILILPAIISGNITRLFIEYISRYNPKSILHLSVVSRMDPLLLNFFTGISSYRNAAFRFSVCINFPIEGYIEKEFSCPICALKNRLQAIVVGEEFYEIQNIIKSKINSLEYLVIEGDSSWIQQFLPVSEDIKHRTYIRALFESARYNIHHRRELNAILENNEKFLDIFIQIISDEYLSPQFSISILQDCLFKTYSFLLKRIEQIIKLPPSFPLHKYIFAIEFLQPGTLSEKMPQIIENYSDDYEQIKVFTLAILVNRVLPKKVELWSQALSKVQNSDVLKLLKELLAYFPRIQSKYKSDVLSTVDRLSRIYADLIRSSLFVETIDKFKDYAINFAEIDIATMRKESQELCFFWNKNILSKFNEIREGPLWKVIGKDGSFETSIENINKTVIELPNYFSSYDENYNKKDLMGKLVPAISYISKLSESIGQLIYSFVVDPTKCNASNLFEGEFKCLDGSVLTLKKDIDYKVDLVFCNLNILDYICGQLISNWKKHKNSFISGSMVTFRIRDEHPYVALDFEDDIKGDFDMRGIGGLFYVQENCRDYGAEIKVEQFNDQKKCFTILLPKMVSLQKSEKLNGKA